MKRIDTSKDSMVGKLIREIRKKYSLGEEIARKFILACALEPLADKPGCTTRFTDIKESKSLEYFIAAAVNSGFAIKRFVDYVIKNKKLLDAYQFFPEMVVASKFNRRGGKINQGILEAVIPVIAAQVVYYSEIKNRPLDVLLKAAELLHSTSEKDVDNLILGKEIANEISGVADKYPVARHDVANVYDYYAGEAESERQRGDITGALHNEQFINGFKDIKEMLQIMTDTSRTKLVDKSAEAYEYIRNKHDNKIGVGLAADHCAICLYLYISLIEHREVI